MADSIANPIINSPYEAPQRHFEIGTVGPTEMIVKGRLASESFIPIAQIRRLDDDLLVAMGSRSANASVAGSANESNRLDLLRRRAHRPARAGVRVGQDTASS